MIHTSIPDSVRRLRRHAKRLTPELSRLGGAVGDTLDAAASAANDTARTVTRRVRRQRTARRRHRGTLVLLLLGGIGVGLALLARAEANRSSDDLRPDTDHADEPGDEPGDATGDIGLSGDAHSSDDATRDNNSGSSDRTTAASVG
jgi:hypothetical protein